MSRAKRVKGRFREKAADAMRMPQRDVPGPLGLGCQSRSMEGFESLRTFCLCLFAAGEVDGEDIVDVAARDAAEGLPESFEEGVRVAFTLTYSGMGKLDGPAHSALERLILAANDDA